MDVPGFLYAGLVAAGGAVGYYKAGMCLHLIFALKNTSHTIR